mgnify:CR=1 FL=1
MCKSIAKTIKEDQFNLNVYSLETGCPLNEPQLKELNTQKDLLETQQIVFLIERISYYIKEVKLASNQHLWLEVGMIDLANMTENTALLDLQNRVKALEGGQPVASQYAQQVVTRPAPIAQPARAMPLAKISIHFSS